MTPHEKALSVINARLARLQANLREAGGETARQFLLQSIIVTIAASEALNGYMETVGRYAQRRYGELKEAKEALETEHAALLKSGMELLEKLKANPTERALSKEIDRVQSRMAAVQKTLRRGANALQRELGACLAMIDPLATSVRHLGEADQVDALKRLLKAAIAQVRDLYSGHTALPIKVKIEAEAWEKAAVGEIDQAAEFYDAYARAGYQMTLALELMALTVAESPPATADEATLRAQAAAAARLKEITARFSS